MAWIFVRNRFQFIGAVFTLASVLLLPSGAVGADTCGSVDRLITALRLARTLYPELRGERFDISLSAGHGSPPGTPTNALNLGVELKKPEYQVKTETNGHRDTSLESLHRTPGFEPPLYFEFTFVELNGISSRRAVCHPVLFMNNTRSRQIEDARALIDSHPEWTNAQDTQAIDKLGMRFGPNKKAAMRQLIPLKQLSWFYGPLQLREASFAMTFSNSPKQAGVSFADLHWRVEVQEVRTSRILRIAVEPFYGRVTSIAE